MKKEKLSNSNNQDFNKLSDDILNFVTGGDDDGINCACGNNTFKAQCLDCIWIYIDDTTYKDKKLYYCISTTPNTLLK